MHDIETDAETKALLARVRPFTMTSDERLVALKEAVEYVCKFQIPGDIVECGVWRGGSMMLAALTLLGMGDIRRRLWLYDTFEGMPPPGEFDRDAWGNPGKILLRQPETMTASDVEVFDNLKSTGYPITMITFVRGKTEDTVRSVRRIKPGISVLRLDTDWYESTKAELEGLYPLLSPGGVLIVDDYGHWLGAKKATDEYFEAIKEPILFHRVDYTGRVAVKPRAPWDRYD